MNAYHRANAHHQPVATNPSADMRHAVMVCTGLGFIDDKWRDGIDSALEHATPVHRNVSAKAGRDSARRFIEGAKKKLKGIVFVAVGGGGEIDATEMLGDRAFCVAVQEYAKNGGCVVVHGEGTDLCLFLGNVLGQGWAANARGYREEDWQCVVDAEHGTWGSKTLRGGLHETARKREGGLSFKAMTRRGPRSLLHSCGKSSSLHLPSYLVIKITFLGTGITPHPWFQETALTCAPRRLRFRCASPPPPRTRRRRFPSSASCSS